MTVLNRLLLLKGDEDLLALLCGYHYIDCYKSVVTIYSLPTGHAVVLKFKYCDYILLITFMHA